MRRLATAAKQTRDRVDSVQAAAREDRRAVTDLRNQLERLTEKMTDTEDRSRRNNVRLVGLPEGAEGSDAAGFLSVNLSKWIPSLRAVTLRLTGHTAYMTEGKTQTLIFRVLRWHDRSEILRGARQAYTVKCTQDNVTLQFFPDFSPATTIRRKAFNPVLKKMTALGLQPFLIYPAAIKLRHKGEQTSFDSPQKAEDFISSLSQRKTYAEALQGNGNTAAIISSTRREGLEGRDGGDPNCPGDDGGRVEMDTCSISFSFYFFSFLSPPGILSLSIRYNNLFAGKTNTLFSFLEGTNGE